MSIDGGDLNSPEINRAKESIEGSTFKVHDVNYRLCVLSVHRPPSGDMKEGVVFRLGIRPASGNKVVVVEESSMESRVFDIRITAPFNTAAEYSPQIHSLIAEITDQATRIANEHPIRRVVSYSIGPGWPFFVSLGVSLAAAIVGAFLSTPCNGLVHIVVYVILVISILTAAVFGFNSSMWSSKTYR